MVTVKFRIMDVHGVPNSRTHRTMVMPAVPRVGDMLLVPSNSSFPAILGCVKTVVWTGANDVEVWYA